MTQTTTLKVGEVTPISDLDVNLLKDHVEYNQKNFLEKFVDFVKKRPVLATVVGITLIKEGGIHIVIHGLKFGVETVWKTMKGISTIFVEGGKQVTKFGTKAVWVPLIGTLIVLLIEIIACIIKWYYNGYHKDNKKNTSLFWKAIRNTITSTTISGCVALGVTIALAVTGLLAATWQVVVGAIGVAIVGCFTKWFVNWCWKKWDDYHNAYSTFARERNKLIEEGKINEIRWPTSLSVLVDYFDKLRLLPYVVKGTLTVEIAEKKYRSYCELHEQDESFRTGGKLKADAWLAIAKQYVLQIQNKAKGNDGIKKVQECVIDACEKRLNPDKCLVM